MVATLASASEDWISWRLIGNVLDAVDNNRTKLKRKSAWLAAGQSALLVTLMPLGAYFVYTLLLGSA